MASDNNGLFLRTVAACAVFMTCLLGALLYNASVREMQRLHDEVAALRSDVLDLRQKLNAWSENTAVSFPSLTCRFKERCTLLHRCIVHKFQYKKFDSAFEIKIHVFENVN